MLRTIFVVIIVLGGAVYSLRGAFFTLLFYLWIAYFRPESWLWFDFISRIDLSFYVGGYLLVSYAFSAERARLNFRLSLLGFFLLQSLISTLRSDHFAYCWPYWIAFAKVIIITYLLANMTDSLNKLKQVILVISISLAFEGAKQGWVQLILNPGSRNDNPILFLGDNNGVAVGMLMLVPLLLALFQTTQSRWMKSTYLILAIGVTYRALSTYSRGGLIAFLAMLGVYWCRSEHKVRISLAAFILAILILPVFPKTFWNRMQTITATTEEMDSSVSGRLYFWGVASRMTEQHPFFGTGHNGFQAAYNDFDLTRGQYGKNRAVHSMWFGILSESGVPGLLMFMSLFFVSWKSCRHAQTFSRNAHLMAFAVAVETGLITAAVGGTFLSFQYVEMLWHFFGLSISLEQISHASAQRAKSELGAQRNPQLVASSVAVPN